MTDVYKIPDVGDLIRTATGRMGYVISIYPDKNLALHDSNSPVPLSKVRVVNGVTVPPANPSKRDT
jgi:hypothetical protein